MGCSNFSKDATKEEAPKNKVLVVVGPSGVGKDTLMNKLFERHPNNFQKAVTHTTRGMREGEEEGKNYYYVSKEEFEKLKDEGGFVETNFYNNNYYGTSKKELNKAAEIDKIMYFVIDVNGATAINDQKIPANFIAFLPPSVEVLRERLSKRNTESEEVIKGRIETAEAEIPKIEGSAFFNYKIINDDMERAVNELEEKVKILYPNMLN